MEIGEIKRGYEIGKGTGWNYIWQACSGCGKLRWVCIRRDSPISYRCVSCGSRNRKSKQIKGSVKNNGYNAVWVSSDDFFFEMVPIKCRTKMGGYVPEHRLIMAKNIGRNLHSWEIIHHKNYIKDDNRLENLQLITSDKHNQMTILESMIHRLQAENTELRVRLKDAGIIVTIR